MKIIKERTRLIFTEYTDYEKKKLEDIVGTMDKVFSYEDPDNMIIAFPPGMEDTVRKLFPKIPIEDRSNTYWEYDYITPVEHNAQPRNQLQIDFIKFVLDNANKKNKVAGILSPGTGKAQPLTTKIPTPDGYKLMRDIRVGDTVFGSNGIPINVTGVYPQGIKDVYEITFNDGRTARCCKEHLWNIYDKDLKNQYTVSLEEIIKTLKDSDYTKKIKIPAISLPVDYDYRDIIIEPYRIALVLSTKCIHNNDGYEYNNIEESYFKILDILNNKDITHPIPDDYMYNKAIVRYRLLGSIIRYASFHISLDCNIARIKSNDKYLLDQIRSLALGLALTANIEENIITINFNRNFWKYISSEYDRLDKLNNYRYDVDKKYLCIEDIRFIGKEHCQCIKVDAENELYLTEDFIITHNTFMACYSAIKVGLRTLIIVPTSGIKDQWAETLVKMFNVKPEKVKVVNSPKDFINVKNVKADFVIVSQASLAVLNKTYNLEKIMKNNKFGIKVIDEVQMWFHNIIKVDGNSNICHNWYLTGTFGRSGNEENELYQHMFGDLNMFREEEKTPTLFNRKPGNIYGMKPHMHVKMMWTKSGLSKEEITSVTNSMRYSERAEKWMRYGISIPAYTNLVIPPDGTMTRHLKHILDVVKMAEKEVTYGKMLILDSTIGAVEVLYDYVTKMFPNKKVGTIHSRNTKAENDRVKAECDILISTVKSCGTGFDVKDLSKLVVSAAFSSWILTDQVSGRLRRRPDGKDTYMWDIVDAQIPQLRAWANNRADILKRKSKTFKVIDM